MRAAAVVTGRVLLCLVGMGFGAPAAAQPEGDILEQLVLWSRINAS